MSDDLDDILNSALDDIDDHDDASSKDLSAAAKEAAAKGAHSFTDKVANKKDDLDDGDFEETAKRLVEELNDPEFAKSLEETLKMFSAPGGSTEDMGDEDIPETLRALAEATKGLKGSDAGQAEEMGDEIIQEMMKQFENMSTKEDFQQIMDGMMHQLLSKEVMYVPFKECCDKFPAWLADNEKKLSRADYERYGKQYQCYQRIVAVYETDPENFAHISELMQEMQEYGQPPAEIMKDLAPGLEIGPDGVPVLPGLMGGDGPMPAPDMSQCAQQ